MTDNELAAELEFYKGNEDLISPDLISKASERIYALSANCSLLKASLAQAERESEKATVSAEPFGYFRVTPVSWEDCAETDDGAIPLYAAPQPDRVAELERELREARAWIAMVHEWFDRESSIIYELSESIRVDIAQAVAAEREACAHRLEVRAALYTKDGTVGSTIASCAALIRARGAKGGE